MSLKLRIIEDHVRLSADGLRKRRFYTSLTETYWTNEKLACAKRSAYAQKALVIANYTYLHKFSREVLRDDIINVEDAIQQTEVAQLAVGFGRMHTPWLPS